MVVQKALRGCDFCSIDTPAAFVYPCKSFTVAHVRDGQLARNDEGQPVPLERLIGAWMACRDCSFLIEGARWQELLERLVVVTDAERQVAEAISGPLWAGFRMHRVGRRLPIEELEDCRHRTTEAAASPSRGDVQPGIVCLVCGDVVERLQ